MIGGFEDTLTKFMQRPYPLKFGVKGGLSQSLLVNVAVSRLRVPQRRSSRLMDESPSHPFWLTRDKR